MRPAARSSRAGFPVVTVVGVAAFVVVALLVAVFLDSPTSVFILFFMSIGGLCWGGMRSVRRGGRAG